MLITGESGTGKELVASTSTAGPRSLRVAEAGAVLRALDAVDAEPVERVLDHTAGHKARTCAILGISRPALDCKIEQHGLRMPAR